LTDVRIRFTTVQLQAGTAKVHSGFLAAWNELASDARGAIDAALAQNPDYRFVITGHSLGAGVATVAASLLRESDYEGTDLYTYGSPRVGNDAFAISVSAQAGSEYRITHWNDPTSQAPFSILGYRNTDREYWLSTGPETKLDYTASEVRVCEGIDSDACSGSVFPALTLTPHRYILTDMYACGGLEWFTKSD
jgi:pimeloyl-ACP methyl ester carboxylesterase